MDGLNLLTAKSSVIKEGIKTVVYAILLTKITEDKGKYISTHSSASLCAKLDRIDEVLIRDALVSLEEDNLINLNKNEIVVGEGGELFSAQHGELTFKEETKLIEEQFARYKEMCIRRNKGNHFDVEERLEKFFKKSMPTLKSHDLGNLFTTCYELYHQEKYHRELDGKDVGQLAHLIKLYGSFVAAKMIVNYINSNRYAMHTPTPGLLLNLKDKIYDDAIGKKKKRSTSSSEEGSGF